MRARSVILATAVLAFGASCVIWRGLLFPNQPALPPSPSARQVQFGMRITPVEAAALDRALPADFSTGKDLDETIARLRNTAHINLFVNWRALEAEGLCKQTPVPPRQLGGRTLAEVFSVICADVTPPLACHAEDGVFTISTKSDLAANTVTRVYDVRDLLLPSRSTVELERRIKASVAPGTWRGDGPLASGALRSLSGQLIVTADPLTQYRSAEFLAAERVARLRLIFARRTGTMVGAAMLAAGIALGVVRLVARRRRLRIGLCRQCGYDLRASNDRCPECGTAIPDERRDRACDGGLLI